MSTITVDNRVGGLRVPTRAEVRWELPEGPFTYWLGRITSLDVGVTPADEARQ